MEQGADAPLAEAGGPNHSPIAVAPAVEADIPILARAPWLGTLAYLAVGAMWAGLTVKSVQILPPLLASALLVHYLLRRAAGAATASGGAGARLLAAMPGIAFRLDADDRLSGWNGTAETAAGIDRRWLGRPFADLVAPDDRPLAAAALAEARRSPGHAFDCRLLADDGTPMDCRVGTVPAGHGQLFVVALDVSTAAGRLRDLEEGERLLRQMVDTVSNLVVVVAEGRVVFINAAGARLLGACDPDDLLGRPWTEFLPPFRPDQAQRLRRIDGAYVPVEIANHPVLHVGRPATLIQARDLGEVAMAAESLRASERHLRTVLDSVGDAVILADASGIVRSFNRAAERIFGFSAREVVGRPASQLVAEPPSGKPEPKSAAAAQPFSLARLLGSPGEITGRRKEGTLFPLQVTVAELNGKDGTLYLATMRDVSEGRRARSRLQIAERVLECTSEGVMVTDPRGTIQWVNQAFCTISGFSRDEVIGENASLLKSGMQGTGFYKTMWNELRAKGEWAGEIWNRRKNGEAFMEWLIIKGVTDETGKVTHYVGVFSDISRHKRAEETIKHLTYYDAVTGLPNNYLFRDRLRQAIERANRSNRLVAVAIVNLNRFRHVNESLGHRTGDALLREVADRLSRSVRGEDTVARLRSDTFCCILADVPPGHDLSPIVTRILDAFAPSFTVDQHELFITATLGLSIYPVDGTDIDDLVQKAEAALHQCKDKPGSAYSFYTPDSNGDSMERLRLETDLRKAVDHGDFVLYYQPKVQTATGRLAGAEALIRWQHPELGMVSPAKFIPLAEETGLILPIGRWVLSEACRQIRAWQERGLPVCRVAVNLSAHQFRQPDMAETVVRILDDCGVDPGLIEVELTESAVMHAADIAVRRLMTLHEAGIRLAIDDFGTGYSSLAYLKRFPIDALKIDRSFIQDLGASAAGEEIVGAIIAMAHSLNLLVVAEGVETAAQLEPLRRLRCDEIQGFYFSPPVPADRFADFLSAGPLVGKDAR